MREIRRAWPLTDRQIRVIDLVSVGMRDGQIARMMCISTSAAKKLLHRVYVKLGYSNRVQLAVDWRCPLFQLGLEALGLRKAVSK